MMKFSNILKAIIICLFIVGTLYATEEPPQVRFDISVQKSLPASNIVLHYTIQKKAPNLELANQALQEALKKIQITAQNNGVVSSDIKLQSSYASPSEWLFGKDYVVNASAAVTVKDMSSYPLLAKLLTQLDPEIQFDSISFDYSKQDPLWQPLIQEAVQDAKSRKDTYEKLFAIKLRLNFMRESRYAPDSYNPTPFMLKRVNTMATAEASASTDLLPSQVYRLNLEISYIIEPAPAPEPKKTFQIENLLKQTKILP